MKDARYVKMKKTVCDSRGMFVEGQSYLLPHDKIKELGANAEGIAPPWKQHKAAVRVKQQTTPKNKQQTTSSKKGK